MRPRSSRSASSESRGTSTIGIAAAEDRRTPHPARPRGSTGTSRARRCVKLVAVTPRRARGPPIDYANGLPSRQAAGRQYPQTRRSILARGLSGWLARDKPHRAPVPSRQHRELAMVERLYRRQGRPAREGRTSCLTRPANTEISTSIQRCPHAPTPHCSRSIGMPDRDASEQVIAIAGMRSLARRPPAK